MFLAVVDRWSVMKLALVAACLVAALPVALLQCTRCDTVRYLIPRNTDDCIGPNVTVAAGACSGANLYKSSWYRITGTGTRVMPDGSIKVCRSCTSDQAMLLPSWPAAAAAAVTPQPDTCAPFGCRSPTELASLYSTTPLTR
jgi:hypothetical protein